MNHKQPAPVHSFRLQLVDVSALVIGYGMAAVLFRAFWPKTGVSPVLGLFAVGFYLWLGMAMSGPILLMRKNAGPREETADNGDAKAPPRPARTWAELAWLLIGVYWIVMGLFILPIRLQSFRFGDTVLFGLVPVAATLVFLVFGPRSSPRRGAAVSWTHQVAVGLLCTWPIAWFCLIVLGQTML
jgi:hypothetical protein